MSEKSERVETALNLSKNYFNCSQSVLAAFSETYGLDKEMALKLSSGLGSGAKCGELCGAVSGALQVIGLKYGQTRENDWDTKNYCYSKTLEFIKKFKEIHGSIVCRELLDGYDLWTNMAAEETKKLALELHNNFCPKFIESAVKILEEAGY